MTSDDVQLERARSLAAFESREALTILAPDGTITRLEGDSAALASAVLDLCARGPRTGEEISAHVARLTGASREGLAIVGELVGVLRRAGALVPARERVQERGPSTRRVLLAMGGAVAAAHAPRVIQALQARRFEVRAIASEHALRFVAREALEALTHHVVLSSMWQREGGMRAPHIELAAWPDVMLLWPATAATLSRIATGDCSELLSAVAIATRAPVLLAPSMNAAMYEAPSVRRNLDLLRQDGFYVAAPAFAVEVAEAPDERRPMLGGAPPAEVVVRLLEALLSDRR